MHDIIAVTFCYPIYDIIVQVVFKMFYRLVFIHCIMLLGLW